MRIAPIRMEFENRNIMRGRQKPKYRSAANTFKNLLRQESIVCTMVVNEELLCRECALHIGGSRGTGKMNENSLTELYNKMVLLIRNNSIQISKDKTTDSYLEKIDEKRHQWS